MTSTLTQQIEQRHDARLAHFVDPADMYDVTSRTEALGESLALLWVLSLLTPRPTETMPTDGRLVLLWNGLTWVMWEATEPLTPGAARAYTHWVDAPAPPV